MAGCGACLAVGVVILWVVTSELIQELEETQGYRKPLFLTLMCLSSFAFFNVRALCDKTWIPTMRGVAREFGKTAVLFGVTWLLANLCFNAALETTSVARYVFSFLVLVLLVLQSYPKKTYLATLVVSTVVSPQNYL